MLFGVKKEKNQAEESVESLVTWDFVLRFGGLEVYFGNLESPLPSWRG